MMDVYRFISWRLGIVSKCTKKGNNTATTYSYSVFFLPMAKFFRPLQKKFWTFLYVSHVISIYHIGKNGLVQRFLTFFVQKNNTARISYYCCQSILFNFATALKTCSWQFMQKPFVHQVMSLLIGSEIDIKQYLQ